MTESMDQRTTPEPTIPDHLTSYDELDKLWVHYLDLLDQYTQAQEAIKTSLSAGFFSLAQANLRAQAGKRYGADWYDDRMKARLRVIFTEEEVGDLESSKAKSSIQASIFDIDISEDNGVDHEAEQQEPKQEPKQQPSPPATPEPELQSSTDSSGEASGTPSPNPKEVDPAFKDPLKWFGIFTPQELRKAQASFSAAVCGSPCHPDGPVEANAAVVRAVNASRSLRQVESEIRKARKAIKKHEKGSLVIA